MRIYLVRHGETDWNSIRKLQGQTDIPLNDFGKELAELTRDGLSDVDFDFIYASPLVRAIQTAEIIRADRELQIHTDDRLKEIHFGQCEGVIIPRYSDVTDCPIWKFEFDTENYIPADGGETFEEIFERTSNFFNEVVMPMEDKYKNVLIVGHGCMNRTILNTIMGRELKRFWEIKLDNCAVSIIEIEDGVAKVIEPSMKYYEREVNPGAPVEENSIYG